MPSRPWHRRYHGDFAADTAHLSLIELGAYERLLTAQYIRGAGLRRDFDAILRLTGARSRAEVDAVKRVLMEFFEPRDDVDGGWWNKRAYQEITSDRAYRERQAEHGRRGAAQKWGSPKASPEGTPSKPHKGLHGPRARPEPERSKQHTPTTSEVTVEGEAGVKWTPEQQAERERLQSDLEKARRAAGVGESGGLRAIAGSVPPALGSGVLKKEEND